jgi:subfamily B ATP-binding cassette protein MsbA
MHNQTVSDGATTYLRLLKYVRRYWLAFMVSVFGLVLHSFAEVAFVDLLGFITDTVGNLTSTSADASAKSLPPLV